MCSITIEQIDRFQIIPAVAKAVCKLFEIQVIVQDTAAEIVAADATAASFQFPTLSRRHAIGRSAPEPLLSLFEGFERPGHEPSLIVIVGQRMFDNDLYLSDVRFLGIKRAKILCLIGLGEALGELLYCVLFF